MESGSNCANVSDGDCGTPAPKKRRMNGDEDDESMDDRANDDGSTDSDSSEDGIEPEPAAPAPQLRPEEDTIPFEAVLTPGTSLCRKSRLSKAVERFGWPTNIDGPQYRSTSWYRQEAEDSDVRNGQRRL